MMFLLALTLRIRTCYVYKLFSSYVFVAHAKEKIKSVLFAYFRTIYFCKNY